MRVKYIGKTNNLILTHNNIYDVISIEKGWYRIKIDSEDNEPNNFGKVGYLFPPKLFEEVKEIQDKGD